MADAHDRTPDRYPIPEGWEAVIGLEVHAQLKTQAKLFSSAPTSFGAEPNTQTTEVDLGMPGVLPVLNAEAVRLAVRAALGLGCTVQPVSVFARKHYFYPDLPKGYQISQYEQPYCLGGAVPIDLDGEERSVALTRIHMEEDAAKSIHDDAITGGDTWVNLNRAGMPLIEIVSEPDMRGPEEAGAYLRSLRSILRYLDVTEADMEKGHFRCDANVSVRKKGDPKLGVKVELKNLNSFKFVEKAIVHEIERQIEVLEDGGEIRQETRNYDDRTGETRPQRGKEDADDYRYFPDPDLPPLRIADDWLEAQRKDLPELPHAKRARWQQELGLSAQDATVLSEDRDVAGLFEQTLAAYGGDARPVANFVKRDVLGLLAEEPEGLAALKLTPERLAALLKLVDDGKLTASSAREVFVEMARSGEDPASIVSARGLEAVSDTGELEAIATSVLEAHPAQVEQYRAGEQKVMNFLLGQVMRQTGGKADPGAVRQILQRLLA